MLRALPVLPGRSLRLQGGSEPALRLVAAAILVLSGYLAAAAVGKVFPFDRGDGPLTAIVALTELPADFPVPAQGEVEFAGEGEQLPYRIVWRSTRPVAEEAAVYRALLESGRWELMLLEQEAPSYRVRISRIGEAGDMTHWAMLEVAPAGGGSRIELEFIITGGRVHFR